MKNLSIFVIILLIFTGCYSSKVDELEEKVEVTEETNSENEMEIQRLMGEISELEREVEALKNNGSNINEELENYTTDNILLKEKNQMLSDELIMANRIIDSLDMEMPFEKSLIIDMSFNEKETMAMFSIYDSGPYSGIYVYEVDGLELTKLDEIYDAYCEWGPYDDLLICSEGTYIEQSGSIYSAITKELITRFSHLGTVSWLNGNEIVYEQFNVDIIVDNGTEFPYPIDVIMQNIYTGSIERILEGTTEYSYIISDNDGDLVIEKIYEDDSKDSEVVQLNDI